MTFRTFAPICIYLIFFSGCSQPEGYDLNQIQKASVHNAFEIEQTQVIHFDYDKNEKRLVRTFVAIPNSNSDKLKIAINNFINKTNFRGNYSALNFDYADLKTDSSTFYFSGNYAFERIDDEEIFKKALELTIANYTKSVKIDLVFNDKKF